MSFQIKKTHRFLQPVNQPVINKQIDQTSSEYLSDDKKFKTYEWMNNVNNTKNSKPDRTKGLTINSSFRAQEDFM